MSKRACLVRIALLLLCLGCLAAAGCSADAPQATPPDPDTVVTSPDLPETALPQAPTYAPNMPDEGVHIAYAVNRDEAGFVVGETLQEVTGGGATLMVKAVPQLGYRFVCWSDGVTERTRQGDTAESSSVITAIFDYETSDLPAVVLTTRTGRDVTSKTDYIGGTLTLIGAGDENIETSTIEIRGRGNYTWTAHEKKSYKIKFPSKISPLSLGGKSRTWVLLANVCDQSLLRNHTALQMLDEFDHIAHAPNSTSVDVYLNGEYRGVYLLAEEITLSSAHVDLDDSGRETETDTGYLIELSSYATDVAFELAGRRYEIKSDLSSKHSVAKRQRAYIGDYVTAAYNALLGGDKAAVARYIDLDTLVDAYLAEELLKNLDMGWDSFYLHKDAGGKLCFGPLWDFDLSLGNANFGCQYVSELYCATSYPPTAAQSNPWFIAAMQLDWFRAMVVERWEQMLPSLAVYPAYILDMGQTYAASFERNFKRWNIFGTVQNRETPLITSLATYREHYTYLASWLGGRLAWLDGCLHSADYRAGHYAYADGTNAVASDEALTYARLLAQDGTSLNGYIRDGGIYSDAPEVADRHVSLLLDGDTDTKWFSTVTEGDCVEITLMMTEAVTLTDYVLTTGANTALKPYRNPIALVLYGSNNGKVWEQIDAVGALSETLGATDATSYAYAVDAPAAYDRYRIRLCCGGEVQLSELALYGTAQ